SPWRRSSGAEHSADPEGAAARPSIDVWCGLPTELTPVRERIAATPGRRRAPPRPRRVDRHPRGTPPSAGLLAGANRFQREKTQIQLALSLRAIDKVGHIEVRHLLAKAGNTQQSLTISSIAKPSD